VSEISIEPSSGDDIDNTVAVMGGEDWKMDALKAENLLAQVQQFYSYIGPSLTEAVYRKGTIGRAKDDLEATAFTITDSLADINGKAYAVNKALVTQASSAIP
jgi:enoyl-[acyl-carrier protein] reductase/trans-2-enoyl-CoA reductase (NAD+)